jgi:PhnB protein
MATFTPDGYQTATPYLIVRDAPKAVAFYKDVFGAVELFRLTDPSGRVVHVDIKVGDSPIMVVEETPAWGNFSPESPLGGASGRIHLHVADAESVCSRAVAAGAKQLIPVADQFYGQRGGRLQDPFGHIWTIATHKETLSEEEMNRRFHEFLKKLQAK